jgi:Patatin-like phospholipase
MYRSVALGGGGSRGGLLVGALAALEEEMGHLKFPDGIYGCSVGSICAVGLGCGMNSTQLNAFFRDPNLTISGFLPPLRLKHLNELTSKKGVFPMDKWCSNLEDCFERHGFPIREKTLGDLPQLVKIVASNMTTLKPVLFSGDVPIIDALRSSCCLPFLFQPQVVYNNLYTDGGVFTPCIAEVVPPTCLTLHITARPIPIYPSTVETMTPGETLYTLWYSFFMQHDLSRFKNLVWLDDESVNILTETTPADKESMFQNGYSQMGRFISKRK